MKQEPPLLRGEKLKSKAKLIELSEGCVNRYNKGELFIYLEVEPELIKTYL
jgi:hypothetical protein